MKKNIIIAAFGVIILSGCANQDESSENPQEQENIKRSEMIEVKQDPEVGERVGIVEEVESKEAILPHSVTGLLDAEVPGGQFTIGRVLAENEAYKRHYITYVSDGLKISGIMNVPKPTQASPGPWPVLFLNHGYIDPAVYTNGRGLKREQNYFARNGYVVIHSDYRGHAQSDPNPVGDDKVGESGYTKDILGGINAFKSLNPDFAHVNKIGLLGHSMGGGVTMKTLVARPDQVQAAALYAPVSSNYLDNLQRWMLDRIRPDEVRKVQDDTGNFDPEKAAPYSVMTYFDRVQTPIMIHHGDRDKDVPLQWSKDTRDRLQNAGKEVIYHEYPAEGHEFGIQWTQFMERNVEFFDKNLKAL